MSSPANRGWMLSEAEYRFLAKYKDAKGVAASDIHEVRRFAGWGLMELGFAPKDAGPKIEETVKLTAFGQRVLDREHRVRKPFWRALNKLADALI